MVWGAEGWEETVVTGAEGWEDTPVWGAEVTEGWVGGAEG